MKYCMRFHSNKKVFVNGQEAQLRKHERIKISSSKKGRVVRGYYKCEPVFIVAFKRIEKSGKTKIVYLVTSERETPKKTISVYKKRWGIEKVFRTTKQHLGLRDCQARSAAKQEVHIFAVFVAYHINRPFYMAYHAAGSAKQRAGAYVWAVSGAGD